MIIAGIDPGYTTGLCVIDENPKARRIIGGMLENDDFQVVCVAQIPWEKRLVSLQALFYGTFANSDKLLLPEVVVVEAFRLRPGRAMEQVGSEFPSVRIIGIVETLVSLCCPQPLLVYQEPGVIGRVEILEQHKTELEGLIHAGDAYRHVRYYHLTTRR